jgi:hypothetical protein
MTYNEDLHAVVTDKTKKFEIIENDKVVAEYWRINDVVKPYKAKIAVIKDVDKDGHVVIKEVERRGVEYWDFPVCRNGHRHGLVPTLARDRARSAPRDCDVKQRTRGTNKVNLARAAGSPSNNVSNCRPYLVGASDNPTD